MAKTHSLKAEARKRTGSGVLKQMRREGFIPSIVYGGGTENRNIKVSAKAFSDMRAHSASDNILVDLEIDGGHRQLAFLKDVQQDPLTGKVLHADFLAVNQDSEITAQIPLELTGEAVGVKMGGVLEQQLHDVEIRCLPKDLPETIVAAIEHLEIGQALHAGDVTWPEGVTPGIKDDVVVALVAKARTAITEEEEAEAAELAAEGEAPEGPEVIGEKSED